MHSSTWLARDNFAENFVAIKVLTGHITDLDRKNVVWESDALRAVSHQPASPNSIRLLKSFTVVGKDGSVEGDHLCFVTPVYGGNVNSLFKLAANAKTTFPLHLAKRILLHVLRGLHHAHSRGVVHADIKMDNIFFNLNPELTTQDIEQFLAQNPPQRHDPEISHEGMIIQSAVSQHFPPVSLEQAANATFILGDFGSGNCLCFATHHDSNVLFSSTISPSQPPTYDNWSLPSTGSVVGRRMG